MISSWLLDLTAQALALDPHLSSYEGQVSDSGEGRWTIAAAVDEGVPVPVLTSALFARFSSRGRALVADKILSAMRAGFGGPRRAEGDDAMTIVEPGCQPQADALVLFGATAIWPNESSSRPCTTWRSGAASTCR